MGLFNKLKNVLFEEEEIEEVEEQPKERKLVKKEQNDDTIKLPKIPKEPRENKEKDNFKEYDFESETDKELFEAERTFDFPAFDEDEFDDFIPKKKEEPVKKVEKTLEEKYKKDFEQPKRRDEYTSTRIVKPKQEIKHIFKPSPVISPVYGILDKNYKKEDVITRDEKLASEKVKLDVDSVRKKAFGTLEENLETTVTEPTISFYEEASDDESVSLENEVVETIEDENLDNLLENTVDVEIDVTKEMELPSRSEKTIEELEEDYEDSLEDLETPEKDENDIDETEELPEVEKIEDSEEKDEENDLFDLIDSMYENKEEE